MTGLPNELYHRCREILLKCSEFDSNASLQAVFVTKEISPFRSGLPDATSRSGRVDKCLDYLLPKYLNDGRAALPLFLAALRDKYQERNALHKNLGELAEAIRAVLISPDSITTSEWLSDARAKQDTNTQPQQIDTDLFLHPTPPYLPDSDDLEQFINRFTRCIMETNLINSNPRVAAYLWFEQRQKAWETSWTAIAQLQDNLDILSNSDFETVMEIADVFDQLSSETHNMLCH